MIKIKKWVTCISAVALSFSLMSPVLADSEQEQQFDEVREATGKYLDYKVAEADGYINLEECAVHPEEGGMGIHFLNPAYVEDPSNDMTKPEILLYEPVEDGYKLVGVEYYVPAELADETPNLFGQDFDGPMDNHDGTPGHHYDLHVWLYEENPNGVFAQFNPNVECHDHDEEAGEEAAEDENNETAGEAAGKELPQTSTNAYNWILAGSVLLVSGAFFFLYQRRKQSV